jgi:hypothetical protein
MQKNSITITLVTLLYFSPGSYAQLSVKRGKKQDHWPTRIQRAGEESVV